MIDSLHVSGYKLFDGLLLPKLGRLNLLVGENNTGKSCLLEAVGLYAGRNPLADIIQAASNRSSERLRPWDAESISEESTPLLHPIFDLFHRVGGNPGGAILIEKSEDAYPLKIDYRLHNLVTDDEGLRRYLPAQAGDILQERAEMAVRVFRGDQQVGLLVRNMLPLPSRLLNEKLTQRDAFAVAHLLAGGYSDEKEAEMWDMLVQGPGQELVLDWLRMLEPRVQDLVYIAGRLRTRIPLIKVEGEGRIPLRNMGDGLRRLYHIGLAMASAARGVVLIDEFENGLYWKTQEDVWVALGKAARERNVQIFATTHSSDCIKGFINAHKSLGFSDSTIYRLERIDQKVVATNLPVINVDAAMRERGEVR